jgi:non-heme chloroperoxidase
MSDTLSTDVPITTVSEHEAAQVARANETGLQPIAFVHGLWLLPSSWDRWVEHFEAAGYTAITPGWPDDPGTVAEAKANPDVFAGKSFGDIADHVEAVIRGLDRKPAVIGHSFGGLLTQVVAGRGLAAASVAISPAPFRGVLPLPLAALRSSSGVLSNPRNRHRAVPLSYEQFRYAFGNAVDEDEAKALYESYSVAGSGEPIFQVAAANLNPWTELKVETRNPDRGPMLVIAAEEDHTVPTAIAKASYKKQQRNEASPTEYFEFSGRAHALVVDHGWRDVADKALEFVKRYV